MEGDAVFDMRGVTVFSFEIVGTTVLDSVCDTVGSAVNDSDTVGRDFDRVTDCDHDTDAVVETELLRGETDCVRDRVMFKVNVSVDELACLERVAVTSPLSDTDLLLEWSSDGENEVVATVFVTLGETVREFRDPVRVSGKLMVTESLFARPFVMDRSCEYVSLGGAESDDVSSRESVPVRDCVTSLDMCDNEEVFDGDAPNRLRVRVRCFENV